MWFLRMEQRKQKEIQTNIDSVKKQASKEMEQSEKLECLKMRFSEDLGYLERQREYSFSIRFD